MDIFSVIVTREILHRNRTHFNKSGMRLTKQNRLLDFRWLPTNYDYNFSQMETAPYHKGVSHKVIWAGLLHFCGVEISENVGKKGRSLLECKACFFWFASRFLSFHSTVRWNFKRTRGSTPAVRESVDNLVQHFAKRCHIIIVQHRNQNNDISMSHQPSLNAPGCVSFLYMCVFSSIQLHQNDAVAPWLQSRYRTVLRL